MTAAADPDARDRDQSQPDALGRGAPLRRSGAPRLRQDRLAADADPDRQLHPQLSRSHQRQLRRVDDERGDRIDGRAVRSRVGRLLSRLLPARGPEQPGALPVRCAPVDLADHDFVGAGVGGNGAGGRSYELLRAQGAARRRGGRLLPRGRLLSGDVVPRRVPDAHHRVVHGGDPDFVGDRRARVGPVAANGRRRRPGRMAVALPRRRPSRRRRRPGPALDAGRHAREHRVAVG